MEKKQYDLGVCKRRSCVPGKPRERKGSREGGRKRETNSQTDRETQSERGREAEGQRFTNIIHDLGGLLICRPSS
jgi:hypothetical protein